MSCPLKYGWMKRLVPMISNMIGMLHAYSPNPWLVNLRPQPDPHLRLFCLPYAGGGVSSFRSWLKRLPEGIEIWAVQLPGRGARVRESPYISLEAVIEDLSPVAAPFLDRPYAIFGHSLGALVGYELIRRFRSESLPPPRRLFVSACRAPQMPAMEKPLHGLSEEALIAELKRLNGTPKEVFEHAELMHLALPAIRGDLAIYETYAYHPETPLSTGITAFAGEYDQRFRVDQVRAWAQLTSGYFSFHGIKGDHFFIHNAEEEFFRVFLSEIDRITVSKA